MENKNELSKDSSILNYLEILQPSVSHLPRTKDSQSTHCDTVGFVS